MAYRDWKCPVCSYVLKDVKDGPSFYVCPTDKVLLEKVVSAPSVLFKGEGWTPTFHRPGEKEK